VRLGRLGFARERDRGGGLAVLVVEAQAIASLVGPGAVGSEAKIEEPLLAGEAAFAALFVGESEIEMHVCVRRHGAGGTAEMFDSSVDLTLLFEDAAEVVA